MTLEPEGHTGDDLCRFSWDAQIAQIRDGISGDEDDPTMYVQDAYAALDALLARLRLLEDVAQRAREVVNLKPLPEGWVGGGLQYQQLRLDEALSRLDAEGSR